MASFQLRVQTQLYWRTSAPPILSNSNFSTFACSHTHRGNLPGIWTGMFGYRNFVQDIRLLQCYFYGRKTRLIMQILTVWATLHSNPRYGTRLHCDVSTAVLRNTNKLLPCKERRMWTGLHKRESWRYDGFFISRKCRIWWAIFESTTAMPRVQDGT
jgi:hypothetical protein